MFLRLALLSATALAIPFSLAHAEEDTRIFETVEVPGLRPVETGRATASVTVLTEADLAIRLAPNPADQLRAVPGVAVSRSGGTGGLTQVRMRGAEANHTLVLLDGIEVSDPVNGETDFGLLTALPVGRIEVLRGAASSIYGSDAIGGVVSISSAGTAGLTGLIEGGSFATARGELGWRGETFGLAVSGFTTEGVDTSGLGGEKDGSEALSGLASATVGLGTDWSLSLVGLARRSDTDFDSDSDFDGRLNDTQNRTEAVQWLAGAMLAGRSGPLDHVLRASLNEVGRDNFNASGKTDDATGRRTKLAWSPGYTAGAHTLTGLVDFERETYDRRDVQFGGFTNASEAFESYGLAGEYRYTAGAFDITASARHDDNKGRFEDATTWRLGAGVMLDPFGGRLRASVGTGVKNPTFTELFGFFPGSFIGNPGLKPEKSESWEIGWEQAIGDLTWSATYFDADLENEIYTSFIGFSSTPRNRTGKSQRSGVELAAGWQLADNFSLSGQATFFDSQDDTGTDEIRVPDHTASLAADWQVNPDGLRLGMAFDHVGEQGDFDFGAFPARRVTLDAYTLVSVKAEYPVTDRIAVTLRAENLLDETEVDVFGYHRPGAGAFLGLKLR
ncbi:MAG: TonB-dependent receptor domain-containing protein [Hyphomonas sp.]|jgi:vitamin B12 transporter